MSKEISKIKERLYRKYGCKCEVCKKKFNKNKLTAHHIIMRSKGGEDTEENLLIRCYNCHFGVINHMEYDSDEYWELMNKSLAHRTEDCSN